MGWKELIGEGKVIRVSPNEERSKSLFKTSLNTLAFVNKQKIDKNNSNILLRNYYESLIELLHSISYKNGFKVLDHLSFTYYIKEILKNKYYSSLFDKYRRIRNGMIYYGENINLEIATQGVKDIKEIISFIKSGAKNV